MRHIYSNKIDFALLSAYGSTNTCATCFSHMKAAISPHRGRLTCEHAENYVKLETTEYIADNKQLVNKDNSSIRIKMSIILLTNIYFI